MKVETKFNIHQPVFITPIKTPGVVLNIWIDSGSSVYYKVRYFWDGTAKEIYFLEREIVSAGQVTKQMAGIK